MEGLTEVHTSTDRPESTEAGPFFIRAHAPDGRTFVLGAISRTREEAMAILDSRGVRAAESFGYRNEIAAAAELDDEDILNSLSIVDAAARERLVAMLEERRSKPHVTMGAAGPWVSPATERGRA
jgi:hypothetical protein